MTDDYDAFDDDAFDESLPPRPAPPPVRRDTPEKGASQATDTEWRRPTVEELREWLQARPRAGRLLWRRNVTRSKSRRRSKSEIRQDKRSQYALHGAVIKSVPVRELTGEIVTYRAGTSAVLTDEFGRPSVVIPGRIRVLASHAMFALVHGEYPKRLLHKNGNKQDIAIHNLAIDTQAARDERTVKSSGIKSASRMSVRRALKGTALGEAVVGKPAATEAVARSVLEKQIEAMSEKIAPAVPGERATSSVRRAVAEGRVDDARSAVESRAAAAGEQAAQLGRALRRAGRRR
jgi:hypothetical protein